MSEVTDLAEATANVHAVVPILGAMGLEIVEASPGRAAARIPTGPNVNHFGVAYAGSLFSGWGTTGACAGDGTGQCQNVTLSANTTAQKPGGILIDASQSPEVERAADFFSPQAAVASAKQTAMPNGSIRWMPTSRPT